MIELTKQQRQQLKDAGPHARDPETGETYVLVKTAVFERFSGLLGDDDWVRDAYQAAMEVFTREGWDDSRMDVYDELDPRRKS